MKPAQSFYFITNQEKTLYETITNISKNIENIYILVGFFYFSGFIKLKDEFKDKNIKILIGLDIDSKVGRFIYEYEKYENIKDENLKNENRTSIKDKFYNSLIKAFNDTDIFESTEIEEAFRIFVEKIQNGTLEVRKTKKPNHAKLYIFENNKDHNENGEYPGIVITGSSNLSIYGIKDRFEIDVLTRDPSHYNEAYNNIYKKLWDDSIPVATKENFDEFKSKVIDKIWIDKLPSPYLVFLRVLEEYFSINKKNEIYTPKDAYSHALDLKYQKDAIIRAIDILNKHNGVIIADVVGLGKSVIASTIAYNLHMPTIIITPPHLKELWETYKRQYDFRGEVYTIGKIEDAINNYKDIGRQKLIIIDEAHRFRNSETANYAHLWRLCQGNKVILLTATPFNNAPQDIESLIKLFQIPNRSTLKHIHNLNYELKILIRKYKELHKKSKNSEYKEEQIKKETEEISAKIRHIISPITIRRTRTDLEKIEEYKEDLQNQGIVFPKVNTPEIISYSFNELDKLYLDTINYFADEIFKSTRYKVFSYISDKKYKAKKAIEYASKTEKESLEFIEISQASLAQLIKRLFVKRFESSFGSFEKTLNDYILSHQKIKGYYNSGRVPIYKKFNELPEIDELKRWDDYEIEEFFKELEEEKGLIWIDSDKLSKDFINDLENDIKILEKIKDEWKDYINKPLDYDYKLKELTRILTEKKQRKEKVIIFSEFEDTVNYLYENLKDKFKVVSYSSSKANEKLREEIKLNFDASIIERNRKNDYDVLITTDILSEGINLHRANNIINYDIPYNPTRVIQRVGRVNRISKTTLKDINIYNFFPTKIGEKHTNIKNISTIKMYMIHALLGEDTKYLTKEEELRSYFYQEYEKYNYNDEESWDVKYRNLLNQIKKENPELIKEANDIPKRTKIKRIKNLENPIYIVFAKIGDNLIFKKLYKNGDNEIIENIDDESAIKIFKAQQDEISYKVSDNFYEKYDKIKKTLYTSNTMNEKDRWEQEILAKLDSLNKCKNIFSNDIYIYIQKLNKIVKEYKMIPKYFETAIKEIRIKNCENINIDDVKKLMEKLPESDLDKIIKRAYEIETESEEIIISEEIV